MDKLSSVSRNYKKCVICSQRRTPGSNVYLARMPLDPDRCRKWVKAIGQEDLVYLPLEKLHNLKFVCNKHFQAEDFNKSRSRLLSHAVPTLNLPLKPLEDKLFEDFPLHIGQYPKEASTENVGHKVDQDQSISQPVPSTSIQNNCFPVQTSPQHENINVLEDLANLDSQGLVSKRKSIILDSFAEAGPSCAEISVQGHKRKKENELCSQRSQRTRRKNIGETEGSEIS